MSIITQLNRAQPLGGFILIIFLLFMASKSKSADVLCGLANPEMAGTGGVAQTSMQANGTQEFWRQCGGGFMTGVKDSAKSMLDIKAQVQTIGGVAKGVGKGAWALGKWAVGTAASCWNPWSCAKRIHGTVVKVNEAAGKIFTGVRDALAGLSLEKVGSVVCSIMGMLVPDVALALAGVGLAKLGITITRILAKIGQLAKVVAKLGARTVGKMGRGLLDLSQDTLNKLSSAFDNGMGHQIEKIMAQCT